MLAWFPVQEAELLAYKDKLRLLKTRKLTLVVDLDQTLIHTSTDPHIEPGLPVSIYTHTVRTPHRVCLYGSSTCVASGVILKVSLNL